MSLNKQSTADASNKPMPCLAIRRISKSPAISPQGSYGGSGTVPTLPLDQSSSPGTDILLLANNVLLKPMVLPTWHLSQASMVCQKDESGTLPSCNNKVITVCGPLESVTSQRVSSQFRCSWSSDKFTHLAHNDQSAMEHSAQGNLIFCTPWGAAKSGWIWNILLETCKAECFLRLTKV